ncbi:MAG: amidohydrolase family protein [Candidatus Bathyarchaeota archaeon]|nr:amidohydrolase family protein [Candidatus Bathyarchaeota archaeon]MDH5746556.1 amidohydrolase family protein [Candidatus Bathyarchaeota archaeon]
MDFHVHIDESETANANGIPVKMGRAKILANMEEAGIDISVLLVMAKKGDLAKTRAQNNWLSNICREDPRFEGFGSVHPRDGSAALEEMNRCVEELGLKGFKLHPNTQDFDCGDPALIEVLKRTAELDVPVIIDSYSPWDDAQPSKLLKAILSSPETKICLAHVGMWWFMDFGVYGFAKQRTAIDANVYFDLSASCTLFYQTPFQEQFCWITRQIGPDNLLFGSDFPQFFPKTDSDYPLCSPKFALEAVRNFGYPEDWIPKIVGEMLRNCFISEKSTRPR